MADATYRPDQVVTKIYEAPTRYTISILPADHPHRYHHQIHVVQHVITGDKWTVEHMGHWADRDGNWEPGLYGGADRFFPLDEALAIARRLAPTVSANGERTALDVLNLPREGRR